jgi:hypothetical protein
MVEADLTRMIERRDEKRRAEEGERAAEEMWMESVARYNEREQQQMRAEWRDYHESQVVRHKRTLAALIAHHEGEAEKLLMEDDDAKGA